MDRYSWSLGNVQIKHGYPVDNPTQYLPSIHGISTQYPAVIHTYTVQEHPLFFCVCVGARFVVSPSVAERKGDKDKAVAAAVQLASFWVVTRFSGAASISGLILQLIH